MERITEKSAIVALIDPAAAATGTSTSDVVDMKDFLGGVVFDLQTGSVLATGTVDMEIQEGTSTTSFNTATAVVSITQLSGTADSNKVVRAEVPADKMTDGYRYLRAIVTQGTANSIVALQATGFNDPYGPASQDDLAAVDEIVVAS
jgi:molybdopterin-binding protein